MKKSRCPICGNPSASEHHPFCSRRCKLIDLGRWFGGNYKIPETESDAASSGADTTDTSKD